MMDTSHQNRKDNTEEFQDQGLTDPDPNNRHLSPQKDQKIQETLDRLETSLRTLNVQDGQELVRSLFGNTLSQTDMDHFVSSIRQRGNDSAKTKKILLDLAQLSIISLIREDFVLDYHVLQIGIIIFTLTRKHIEPSKMHAILKSLTNNEKVARELSDDIIKRNVGLFTIRLIDHFLPHYTDDTLAVHSHRISKELADLQHQYDALMTAQPKLFKYEEPSHQKILDQTKYASTMFVNSSVAQNALSHCKYQADIELGNDSDFKENNLDDSIKIFLDAFQCILDILAERQRWTDDKAYDKDLSAKLKIAIDADRSAITRQDNPRCDPLFSKDAIFYFFVHDPATKDFNRFTAAESLQRHLHFLNDFMLSKHCAILQYRVNTEIPVYKNAAKVATYLIGQAVPSQEIRNTITDSHKFHNNQTAKDVARHHIAMLVLDSLNLAGKINCTNLEEVKRAYEIALCTTNASVSIHRADMCLKVHVYDMLEEFIPHVLSTHCITYDQGIVMGPHFTTEHGVKILSSKYPVIHTKRRNSKAKK